MIARSIWSYESSPVKWCEPLYSYHPWVAEWWNALSSLALVAVAIEGWRQTSRSASILYGLMGIIGVGSVWFHATSSFAGQMLDEWGIYAILLALLYHPPGPWRGTSWGDSFTIVAVPLTGVGALMLLLPSQNAFFLMSLGALMAVLFLWQAVAVQTGTAFIARSTIALFVGAVAVWLLDHWCTATGSTWHWHWLWHILIAGAARELLKWWTEWTEKK